MHRVRPRSFSRRITPKLLGLFLLGVAPAACADRHAAEYAEAEASESARSSAPPSAAAGQSAANGPSLADTRMIIRNAVVELQDEKPGEVVRKVEALTRRLGGFVVNSHSGAGEHEVAWANCTVRIPSTHFDQALGELRTLAKLRTQHVKGRDVTAEFVDIQARVKNKKRLEQRFVALTERTGQMSELLEVERELARVRQEIEQLEGQSKYLRDSAAMSKVEVKVSRPPALGGPLRRGLGAKLGEALERSWEGFGNVLAMLVTLVFGGMPIYLTMGAGVWFYRRRRQAKLAELDKTGEPGGQNHGGYRAPGSNSIDEPR